MADGANLHSVQFRASLDAQPKRHKAGFQHLTFRLRCAQVAGVVVGEGYRFGYKAAGDTAVLKELGSVYGVNVEVVPLLGSGPEGQVSSSRVRDQLAGGEMDAVADLLGRRYNPTSNMHCTEFACCFMFTHVG
jgi:FAD synthase